MERGFTRFLNENISLYATRLNILCVTFREQVGETLMNFTKIKGTHEKILLRALETLSSLVPCEW